MTGYETTHRDGIATLSRAGHGSPLVILPGVMADARSWCAVADAIEAPNPVVVVNRRGRAPSRDLGAAYGVPTEIADLAALLVSIGEPAHLFGWSYGGLVAIEAAAAGPVPIRSLIAYEPVSRPFAPEAIGPIREALARGDAARAVEIVNLDVSGFARAHVEALRRTPAWVELCRLALPLGEELAAIDGFEPAYERYSAISVPATLILGALNEGEAPYGTAFERFARATPHAAIERLPSRGHLAHVEDPGALGRLISQIVARAERE